MTEPPSALDLLTAADLVKLFGKSEHTIGRWVKRKLFPEPVRPGGPNGRPYWAKKVIEDYIAAGSMTAYRRIRRNS